MNSEEPARTSSWLEISKTRAFLSHLALSTFVVGIVLLIVFLIWYPSPYFEATGTMSVIKVLISVDLVVGPVLTAIVFKPGKPSLKFDLSVIATIQLAALTYGVGVLYSERPYFMVFAVDRFYVLADKDLSLDGVPDGKLAEWLEKPLIGPLSVAALRPQDAEGWQRLLEETLFEGKPDIERRPEFWRPYEDHRSAVLARAADIPRLREGIPEVEEAIDDVLEAAGKPEEELAFLPLSGKKGETTAIIDRADASIVAVLEVDPWPLLCVNCTSASAETDQQGG